MKKNWYMEEQIIGILKQHEAGVRTADLCREHGIGAATFYGWKSKYGGMEVGEAQRLKQLEDENQRLGLRRKLIELARQKPRYGTGYCMWLLTRRGFAVNVKQVYRLYREEGLMRGGSESDWCTRFRQSRGYSEPIRNGRSTGELAAGI